MVIRTLPINSRVRASLITELLVAMAILAGVMIPLAWSLRSERVLARSLYQRAVAIEIVDGELEVLQAGEWKVFAPGTHPYTPSGAALTNLPPGQFTVTIATNLLRLEWRPQVKHHGGAVTREAPLL